MSGVPVSLRGSVHLANLREGLADRHCRLLAVMFLSVEALDELTTTVAVAGRGLGEANPLFAPLLVRHLVLALLLKGCVVVLATLGALAGLHRRRRLFVLRVCVTIGIVVVAGNALALARA